MLESWALAYAERWGLPADALDELRDVLAVAEAGSPQEPEPTPIATAPPTRDASTRYEDIGYIGMGGMGEVRRVWDCAMNRPLAMKILRKELLQRVDLVARFKEEAEATAQLEHPCIVPIHDMGTITDGRVFFTMKEVRGRTLLEVIDEIHTASTDSWGVGPSGWSLVKIVQLFVQVCECIAYAHSRSVLHRDLKPSNVMVGAFGEVAVMDWGLAKIKGSDTGFGDSVAMGAGTGPVITQRSREGWVTRHGSIAGTPNYMAPEQATGDHGKVGPWSDVYALGAILYHIIADRPPYEGYDVDGVVRQVLDGPPPPPTPPWRRHTGQTHGIEDGLITVCEQAMSRKIADRHMDAATLAEAVQAWLEGARVRDQALAMIARADALEPDILEHRRSAASLRAKAERKLEELSPNAPASRKQAAWDLQDEATRIDGELADLRAEYSQLLHAALAWLPDLPEARERLATLSAEKSEGGVGYITLHTDHPTEATAHPIHVVSRRRVEGEGVPLGSTPLDRAPLPAGSWMIRAGHLAYPARIVSGEHWASAAPGTRTPICFPTARPRDGTIHIPASWTHIGGDLEREDALPRQKVWVDGFNIMRHPVRCDTWAAFLNELEGDGRGHLAAAFAPSVDNRALWTLTESGWRWPDDWRDDQPVRAISWEAACAFASWSMNATGLAWRIPTEVEWEKAARGTDERLFPWGDFADPTWCCVGDSHNDRPRVAPVGAFPSDVSPYGVRGLGGNVRDWCIATTHPENQLAERARRNDRIVRGGHWLGITQFARSALRYRLPKDSHPGVGLRLVYSLDS